MKSCNLDAGFIGVEVQSHTVLEWRKADVYDVLRHQHSATLKWDLAMGVSCRKAEDGKNKAEKTVQELKDKMQADKNATTESIQKKLDEALAAKAPEGQHTGHGPSLKIKCIEFGSSDLDPSSH